MTARDSSGEQRSGADGLRNNIIEPEEAGARSWVARELLKAS